MPNPKKLAENMELNIALNARELVKVPNGNHAFAGSIATAEAPAAAISAKSFLDMPIVYLLK